MFISWNLSNIYCGKAFECWPEDRLHFAVSVVNSGIWGINIIGRHHPIWLQAETKIRCLLIGNFKRNPLTLVYEQYCSKDIHEVSNIQLPWYHLETRDFVTLWRVLASFYQYFFLSIFRKQYVLKMFLIKVAALYINNRYENIVNLLLINCFDESFFGNTLSICLRVCTPDRICRYTPSFVFPTAFNQSLSYFIWFLKKDFFCNNIAAIFFLVFPFMYFSIISFLPVTFTFLFITRVE